VPLSSVRKFCIVFLFVICCSVCCLSVSFADSPLVANNNVDGLTHAQYIGGGYIRGVVTGLGDVEIYFPYSSRHSWGLTADSFLCNINSSSVSGIMYDSSGRQYNVSCSGFSIPRYRPVDSSGYQYTDMYCSVYSSNLDVHTSFQSAFNFENSWPYITIGLMGVIIVCMMRFKH
jgi:hypothetical protein